MASRTQRFGLNYFGGATPGSLSDDAGKFSGRDRQLIDRVLGAFEIHDHSGGDRLEDPISPPTLSLSTTGGQLLAGQTYYYRVSYVDKFGLETAAGPEVFVSTPAALSAPPTPQLTPAESTAATPGPGLDPGVYYFAATWHTADGTETTLSAPGVITMQGDFPAVRVSFVADPGVPPAAATQVSIWRQGPLDAGFTRIATVPTAGFTYYEDDGSVASDPCACDPENLPPDVNETNATNRIAITLPAAEINPPTLIERWRIYRSTVAGAYPAASLLAEVAETADELSGALVSTYVDDGTAEPTAGAPLSVSQTLRPSVDVGGGGIGGQVFLADANGITWRIYTSGSGLIYTEALPAPVEQVDAAFALVDVSGATWRVTIGTDGALTTAKGEPLVGERTWAHGTGPHLPTFDASLTWRLGIGIDGALETFGDSGRANRIELESRDEPATPTGDAGSIWVNGGQPRYKGGGDPAMSLVRGSGVERIYVSSTPPENPQVGDLWIEA